MISLLGESNDNLLFHVLTANRLIHKSIYPSAKVTSVSSMQTLMHSLASSKTLIQTWSRWDRAAYIWSAILSMLEKKMKPTGMTYFYVIVSYLLINFLTQSVDDGFVLLFVIRERQNHCRYTGENDLDMECTPEREEVILKCPFTYGTAINHSWYCYVKIYKTNFDLDSANWYAHGKLNTSVNFL